MRSLVLALVLTLGACASPPDHAAMVRSLDEATLRSEVRARFSPALPQPLPEVVADLRAGQRADAEYFAAFPRFDRSYAPRARAQAQRLADRLVADAEHLSHEQFMLRVAEIAALADNGHTLSIAVGNASAIPVRMYLFADGLRVLYANERHADLIGARIDHIEGRRIDDIYRAIARYQGGGTPARRRLLLLSLLQTPALLEAAGLAQDKDSLTLSGVLADGTPFQRRLVAEDRGRAPLPFEPTRLLFLNQISDMRGLALGHVPVSLQNSESTFWSGNIDSGLYVRLTENADPRITPFLDGVLASVREAPPRFIVLDMRMNNGGNYTRTYAFARALPEAARDAHIYVLTSPWTFSAAITTISALKEQGGDQVTIVGENVGDRLDFWAEGGLYLLPNTRTAVLYSTARHVYNGPCQDLDTCFWLNYIYPVHVRTLRPDIAAPWTFEAYREGRDPALEAVLAREARAGSSAGRP